MKNNGVPNFHKKKNLPCRLCLSLCRSTGRINEGAQTAPTRSSNKESHGKLHFEETYHCSSKDHNCLHRLLELLESFAVRPHEYDWLFTVMLVKTRDLRAEIWVTSSKNSWPDCIKWTWILDGSWNCLNSKGPQNNTTTTPFNVLLKTYSWTKAILLFASTEQRRPTRLFWHATGTRNAHKVLNTNFFNEFLAQCVLGGGGACGNGDFLASFSYCSFIFQWRARVDHNKESVTC